MSLKLLQQVKFCQHCNKNTMCNSNTKEMNWIMHLVLCIFTLGIWLLIVPLIGLSHGLSKPSNKWICSECGKNIALTYQGDVSAKESFIYKKEVVAILVFLVLAIGTDYFVLGSLASVGVYFYLKKKGGF